MKKRRRRRLRIE